MAVNKVILIGNLGADPQVKHFPDGTAFANVNLATTENWRDKSGEKASHTEWHRLTFFARQAEIASEYLRKGSKIYVEGSLRTRKWTDKEGVERYTTEIRVMNFQFLDTRASREGGGESRSYGDAPASSGRSSERAPARDSAEPFGDSEEDIPW
ncbi:MAG: single-stranded DNA-binding protein [Betaproteobacteria bacterium AqS2]|uniref:Single-stranded DNA-binding protein n=1 Tax=Candidatus Amphirhobacter heronislandensis TaxID=1732024 RepID=A0A930UH76_9GAMM|nr:single-stranded DNA-binding protein [Betaproteobacteria bacterium AqS2]